MTTIIDPIVTGIYGPIETGLNGTLSRLNLLGLTGFPAPLSVNVNSLLTTAASGAPITLKAIASNGALVGPGDPCNAQADSYTLTTPKGVSIGGNAITGLGASGLGQEAVAGEIDSIALGNRARTDPLALGSIALGADAIVGAGGTGSIAFGQGSSVTVANSVALGAGSVASRGPQAGSVGEVSVGAPGALRQITNVAAGTAPTDVATVGQVQAIATQLTNNSVQYSNSSSTSVVLAGAGGTTVSNVAPGALSATSSEAVNGSQLFATNQQVATNSSDITALQGTVTALGTTVAANTTAITTLQGDVSQLQTDVANNSTAITNLQATVGGNTTAITNLRTNVAGNTADITNLQTSVAGNTTAITNLQTNVVGNTTAINNLSVSVAANAADITQLENVVVDVQGDLDALTQTVNNLQIGNAGPVRYSNAATPTAPNGGTPTNDVTLAGAAAGGVRVHNVAAGSVAAGSTDAVNGGQLAATNVAVAAAQTTANQALQLNQNAVAYDSSSARTSVTLGGSGAGGPVQLRNVAAGTLGTDGVNLQQVRDLADGALRSANQYTDQRIAALNFNLADARKEARTGAAAALAAAGLPAAVDAGANMIAAGFGTYRGRAAFALGVSHRTDDGRAVFRLGLTYDESNKVGTSGGAGFQF